VVRSPPKGQIEAIEIKAGKNKNKKALASFFSQIKQEHKEAGTAKQGTEQKL
jgi:hypothetical protein